MNKIHLIRGQKSNDGQDLAELLWSASYPIEGTSQAQPGKVPGKLHAPTTQMEVQTMVSQNAIPSLSTLAGIFLMLLRNMEC